MPDIIVTGILQLSGGSNFLKNEAIIKNRLQGNIINKLNEGDYAVNNFSGYEKKNLWIGFFKQIVGLAGISDAFFVIF